MKTLIAEHIKLTTMAKADEFTISGNGKDIVIDADSVVGKKIKAFVDQQKLGVLQELKDKVNAM